MQTLDTNGVGLRIGVVGSVEPDRRWLNWAIYIPIPAEDLGDFLVDRHGRRHDGSLAPGAQGRAQEEALKQMARDELPPLHQIPYQGD